MAKKAAKNSLDFGVDFGQLSIGKTTANLGCKISRHGSNLSLTEAEKTFCERRLSCEIILKRPNEDDDQQKLIDDMDHQIDSICDVKRMGVKLDTYSIGLAMNINEVDVATLACFANRPGRLIVKEVTDIPDDSGAEDDED